MSNLRRSKIPLPVKQNEMVVYKVKVRLVLHMVQQLVEFLKMKPMLMTSLVPLFLTKIIYQELISARVIYN